MNRSYFGCGSASLHETPRASINWSGNHYFSLNSLVVETDMRMMENILETILPILLHGVISSRTVGHHFIPPRCLKNSCLFHSGVPQCLCALFLRVSQNKFCMSSLKLSSRPYIPHPLNVKDSIYVVKHSCLVYIIINRPITIYYIQLGFLKAPVVQCGIPQGSPLSPL